jgi:hypothetical protein
VHDAAGKVNQLILHQNGDKTATRQGAMKPDAPRERKEVKVDAKVLESYVGSYAITPQFVMTVTLENGQLMVQATGQPKFAMFPESATKFFLKVVDAQVSFVKDEAGTVNALVLHQNGADKKAVRQQ